MLRPILGRGFPGSQRSSDGTAKVSRHQFKLERGCAERRFEALAAPSNLGMFAEAHVRQASRDSLWDKTAAKLSGGYSAEMCRPTDWPDRYRRTVGLLLGSRAIQYVTFAPLSGSSASSCFADQLDGIAT